MHANREEEGTKKITAQNERFLNHFFRSGIEADAVVED